MIPVDPIRRPLVTADPAGASDGTDLTITIRDGGRHRVTWRLTCDPPGGDHPDPEAACRALSEHGEQALPAVARGRMCSQVYGGQETATITGRWRGRPVMSQLSRINACEISRWNALVGLLPLPGV